MPVSIGSHTFNGPDSQPASPAHGRGGDTHGAQRAFGYYEPFVVAFSLLIERRFGPPPELHAAVADAVRGTDGFARLQRKSPSPEVWRRLGVLLRQAWVGECALHGLSREVPVITPTVLLFANRQIYSVVWAHL